MYCTKEAGKKKKKKGEEAANSHALPSRPGTSQLHCFS